MPSPVPSSLENLGTDRRLSREEAVGLKAVTGDDFNRLMSLAAQRRDRNWGRTITYSRKVFIPLTNLCRDTCGY